MWGSGDSQIPALADLIMQPCESQGWGWGVPRPALVSVAREPLREGRDPWFGGLARHGETGGGAPGNVAIQVPRSSQRTISNP